MGILMVPREYAAFTIVFWVMCDALMPVLLVPPQHGMPYNRIELFSAI